MYEILMNQGFINISDIEIEIRIIVLEEEIILNLKL